MSKMREETVLPPERHLYQCKGLQGGVDMNSKIFNFVVFIVLLAFLPLYLCCGHAFGESNESGNFLAAEDWDIGTSPADWPKCNGAAWHGWLPKDYDCSPAGGEPYANGGNSTLDTNIYYSPPRSLKVTRDIGTKDVTDLRFTISPEQTKVHVRMYLYFGSNFQTCPGEQIIHFFLFNSSVSGNNFGVDIWSWTDKRSYDNGIWPPTCGTGGGGRMYWGFHSYHDCRSGTSCGSTWEDMKGPSNPNDCWRVEQHTNQWYCFEWMWDITNKNVKMWIDEELKIDRTMCECQFSCINKIYFSGWNSCASCCEATSHTFWVDNIVIDNKYIGPIGGVTYTTTTTVDTNPPAPPTNLRLVE